MRKLIIHLKDPMGNRVDYVTTAKTATKLVEKYGNAVMWFEKQGFNQVSDVVKPPTQPLESTTQSVGYNCEQCDSPMEARSGVSKTGKAWKGWFCPEKGHPVKWS